MIWTQIRLLTDFYWRPIRAASEALDSGQPLLITILAVITAFAFSIPADRNDLEFADAAVARHQQKAGPQADADGQLMASMLTADFVHIVPDLSANRALTSFAGLFLPLATGLSALITRRGAVGTVILREYGTNYTVLAYAWVAAHIPFAILGALTHSLWAKTAAYACFVVLAMLVLQPVCHLTAGTAIGVALGAAACAQPLAFRGRSLTSSRIPSSQKHADPVERRSPCRPGRSRPHSSEIASALRRPSWPHDRPTALRRSPGRPSALHRSIKSGMSPTRMNFGGNDFGVDSGIHAFGLRRRDHAWIWVRAFAEPNLGEWLRHARDARP